MTAQRVENYLKDQTGSDNPLVAKGFQNLMNLYTNELWNELWQESSRLVRDIDFVLAVDLPQFYEEFIRDFERRIEPLQLVELVTLIAENIFYTDRQKAFDFLDNFDNVVKQDNTAIIRLLLTKLQLRRKDTPTPVASTCTDPPLVRPHNSSTWADACSKGLLDIVERFVENGQGIDDTDENGLSGLMYSSEAGKVDVVRFLLNNPLFHLSLEDGSDDNAILVELRGPKEYSVGFEVALVSPIRTDRTFERRDSGPFRPGFTALQLEGLPAGTFSIRSMTFVAGQEGPFILRVDCSCNFELKRVQ
uniref:PSD13 N-terminal domain-containing protein n=1 Tax=Globodera rostochiensis TaxID=31243 RepID=A0A914HUC5_GLORO